MILFLLSICCCCSLQGVPKAMVEPHLENLSFHLEEEADVMLCAHGASMDASIIDFLKKTDRFPFHLVSFNFPSHGPQIRKKPPEELTFGCFSELIPFFQALRQCVVGGNLDKIHLYGFSAGGGAIVNVLKILHLGLYPKELAQLQIHLEEREQILSAIQKGKIILDCPLKSVAEVSKGQKRAPVFAHFEKIYRENRFEPITSLKGLQGLDLEILLHFQSPDTTLTNEEDLHYIKQIKQVCPKTHFVIGDEGKHFPCLPTLLHELAHVGIR